jgi:anti-anti-sigma factor
MHSPMHIVRLDGEYDLARKDELSAVFGTFEGSAPIVLDMTDVTYVDSSFFSELAGLRLRAVDRSITLRGANEQIRRLLNLVGFHKIFILAE